MRIIAGKYRRRKLDASPGLTTRPIPDRTKEVLFERLGGTFDGEHVADIFSGTGSMGLEALSRGAGTAIFIENDRIAFDLLKSNIETIGIEEDILCWRADVLRCSFRPQGRPELLPLDIIFFDPPYRMVSQLKKGTMFYNSLMRLSRPEICAPGARMLLRTPKAADFTFPEAWTLDRKHRIGSMDIHEFVLTRGHEPDPENSPDSAV